MSTSLQRVSWWLVASLGFASCTDGDSERPPIVTGVLRYSSPLLLTESGTVDALVAVADANDDNWLDVLTWGDGAPTVNVAIPGYGLSSPIKIAGLPSQRPRQVTWADFNGDRSADLVVLDDAGRLRKFHSDAVDEYSEQNAHLPELPSLTAFVPLDINRDGDLDYMLLGQVNESDNGEPFVPVYVLLAEGSRHSLVQTLELPTTDAGQVQTTSYLQPSDVDGDGDWDVVVAAAGVGLGVLIYDEESGQMFDAGVGDGDSGASSDSGMTAASAPDGGTSAAPDAGPYRFRLWQGLTTNTTAVALRDQDHDGAMDALLFFEDASAEMRINDGSGAFEGNSAEGLTEGRVGCVEDFDNDGRLDVLAVEDSLVLRLGANETGEFETGLELDPKGSVPVSSIICVDIDNDGDLDVVTAGRKGTALHLNRLEPATVDDRNYYDFKFVGREGNFPALGSVVELTTGKRRQRREFVASGQALQPSSPVSHWGLGKNTTLDQVHITWPNGLVREDEDWSANDTVRALQPE